MQKTLKKALISSIFSLFIFANANTVFAETNISDYILEPMPGWYSERYTRGHLDVNKMMKNGFTRMEALEVQNQMKDILDTDENYSKLEVQDKTYEMIKNKDTKVLDALKTAINNVKGKKVFESGFVNEPLKDNEFYVAFDIDETLLVQWYKSGLKGPSYYDGKITVLDNILRTKLISPDYYSLIPGFEKTLKDIVKIPGNKGIILFSAKLDVATHDLLDKIQIDGKPIKKFVKGVFTRNYLIREQEPTKLSKDLRMFDESLKHIILVDDNPSRILEKQLGNLREFPKYNPDAYLDAKNVTKDKKTINYFEQLLPVVVAEIKDSEEYSTKHKTTFARAFYPYSAKAQTELLMLIKQGYSMKDAIEMLRKDPEFFETKFFFYEDKK